MRRRKNIARIAKRCTENITLVVKCVKLIFCAQVAWYFLLLSLLSLLYFLYFLSTFGKCNLTHLIAYVMFSGQRFVERLCDFFFLCEEVAWFLCVKRLHDFCLKRLRYFLCEEVLFGGCMIFVVERLSDFFSFPPSLRLYDFLWRLLDFIVEWFHDFLLRGCIIFLLRGCMIFCWGVA